MELARDVDQVRVLQRKKDSPLESGSSEINRAQVDVRIVFICY